MKSEKGIGAIGLLVILGLASIPILGAISFNLYLESQNKNVADISEVDQFKRNLIALINDDRSWIRTSQQNVSMDCIFNPSTGGNGGGTALGPPGGWKRGSGSRGGLNGPGSSGDGATGGEDPFGGRNTDDDTDFFDSQTGYRGPAPGVTGKGGNCNANKQRTRFNLWSQSQLYYEATNLGRGITTNGTQCAGFPSRACPYRYDLQWAPMNTDPFPIIAIFVKLEVGKNGNDYYGNIKFNPLKYSFALTPDEEKEWPPANDRWPTSVIYKQIK